MNIDCIGCQVPDARGPFALGIVTSEGHPLGANVSRTIRRNLRHDDAHRLADEVQNVRRVDIYTDAF